MIYAQKSKAFRRFLRALTADELVTQAARTYACKHRHPILTERQAARFYEMEEARMKRIEEAQWLSSQEDKPPKLYLDTYKFRQQRLAQSQAQIHLDPNGSTWQMPNEDKEEKKYHDSVQKGRRISREHFEARQLAEFGIQPIGNEPQDGASSASSFQWLPDPSSSTLQQAGAPTGTPFLGATAEIEKSINEGGWNWRDMPGNSNDVKWFHFVHRKPLSGYENHPFFTMTKYVKTDGTDRLRHPVPMCDYQDLLPLHPNDNDEKRET